MMPSDEAEDRFEDKCIISPKPEALPKPAQRIAMETGTRGKS